jgi:N6-L-threonylcarbamoyladenine synthase
MLVQNVKKGLEVTNLKKLALAGGVSANSYIREKFLELGKEENIDVYFPNLNLCTDNAGMIASSGYYELLAGNTADLTLNAIPNLKL